MGCLKLTYNEKEDANFFQGLWKKSDGSKKCDNYYPFGLTFNSYEVENGVPQRFKFNGKEEQKELGLGWLDYGRRMYQPDLGRFFNPDRFAEKYYDLNPYQYGANNPLLFMDANGDSLIVNGARSDVSDFTATSNQGTGGFYNTQVDENGQVSLEPTQQVGPPSPQQQAFFNLMADLISDPNNVQVTLKGSSTDTMIGNFYFQTIDIDDILQFGEGPVVSAPGILMHELKEQQAKQSYGMDKGKSADMAHFFGTLSENLVNGSTRISIFGSMPSSQYTDLWGNISGTVNLNYIKNNEQKTVSIIVDDNNIIKVHQ